jgi:hypothetical protein
VPVVLDTNIVRYLAEGDLDVNGLFALRNEGTGIHMAEGAAIELVGQLCEERLRWDKWLRARRVLRELLDKKQPILLGREINNKRSVFATQLPWDYSVENPAHRHRLRYSWQALMDARNTDALTDEFVVPPTGERGVLRDTKLDTIAKTQQSWIASIEMVQSKAVFHPERVGEPKSELEQLERTVRVLGGTLDSKNPKQVPPESVRWDAVIRTVSILGIRSLRSKHSYSARKHKNDAFDFDLLRYLALPAAICTCDQRLMSVLKDAKAWQAKWVVLPEKLSTRAGRQVLADLRWPAPSEG